MKSNFVIAVVLCLSCSYTSAQQLSISDNKRYIVRDGEPFFWLGDTAWEMFHKLTREEIRYYLRNRAAKGFNVVQCVIVAEMNGLTVPNAEGQVPFIDLNPEKPNDKYFELIDAAVAYAAEQGVYIAILPTWGSHVEDRPHPLFENIHPFNEKNARAYGAFLGKRYKNKKNVIWILGGDREPKGNEKIWHAMADGIRTNMGSKQLMSYHNSGQRSSSEFKDAPWIDFNMIQSGHAAESQPNYKMIADDYNLSPSKPVLDAEPNYEDAPIAFSNVNPTFKAFDIRKASYWSVFAGAFGITYGHTSIWHMNKGENFFKADPNITWRQALEAEGASQLKHLKNLILSRSFVNRIPDQSLLLEGQGIESSYITVTRDVTTDNTASYIMAYLPVSKGITLATTIIKSPRVKAWWYNPRSGEAILLGLYENNGQFSVPWEMRIQHSDNGSDWVLIVEDPSRYTNRPGVALTNCD